MDGILLVNKPAQMTSHDVVNRLRRILHIKKIGHTGTLDPQATGLMIVLVGKACKVLQFLKDTDKTYIATIQLGTDTDTMDVFGNTLNEKEIRTDFDFQSVLDTFMGKQTQLVPMTSAKKIHGKKLIDYQRQNLKVEPIYQDVEIYSIKAVDLQQLSFEVHCSSGTYVRSICQEFAHKTGNLGCMKSLVRTKIGRFSLDQAQTLEDIEKEPKFYPVQLLLDHLPIVEIEDPTPVYQGKKLYFTNHNEKQIVVSLKGEPIAVYENIEKNLYASKRGLW